jgi:OFA family oxalate/formate antiporter-like MFS transporter
MVAVGTVLELCLGTTYAWSYFQNPLKEAFGWSHSTTAWAFCLAICCLGLSAAWAGTKLSDWGPSRLAMAGGALFGAGYLCGALALAAGSAPLFFLGYGVVGGCGLGLAYVTPVATVARWFPDRKGLATGMVVMGFGLGALIMSKLLAPSVMHLLTERALARSGSTTLSAASLQGVLAELFAILGVGFCLATVPLGWLLENPPTAPEDRGTAANDRASPPFPRRQIQSWPFLLLWTMFFCNITAGIGIIGFQSPLFQDLCRRTNPSLASATLAEWGATLIGVTSLFNGVGRLFWGGLSDRMGRLRAFSCMLGTQCLVFLCLPRIAHPWLFGAGLSYVLLCYGGGFGTMPSLVLDLWGARLMPALYGAILTAWSLAGVVGPQMVAGLKDHFPDRAGELSFQAGAALVALGLVLSLGLARFKAAPWPVAPDRSTG